MLDADANEAAVAPASVDTGFDATPVTAAPAPAPATVETGFGDLGGTPAPVNTVVDTGEPEDPDVDLDARVVALLPNKSITDWNAVSVFMAAVVPWPGSQEDLGWVVLPNGYADTKFPGGRDPKTNKYPVGPGKPFKTVDKLVSYVGWAHKTHNIKDIFFVLSLQRNVGTSRNGKPQGKKSKAAALMVKAIWLDIDVGKEGAYDTVEDALKAVIKFKEKNGLPPFSAIVGSGGGIHVYWISDKALSPTEWRPYAEGLKALAANDGLKCDLGVTTDIARMLRVPGTFNHKLAAPRPCQLFNVKLTLYEFPTSLAMLPQITPIGQPAMSKATPAHSLFDPAAVMASFQQPPAFNIADPNDTLGAGIDKLSDTPLDPRPIFKGCSFYRDAFATGGRDHKQDLWMYAVLGTTFMKGGRVYAHEISKGHANYAPAETDAMYDRKVAERHGLGLGYPQCSTIQGAGCKSCAKCPLLGKVKSPLNIRPAVTATVTNAASPSGSSGQANWTGRSGISFDNIPHRKWLYGSDFVRGELTVIGSPGGAGKSSLAIGMAICVATNRELLGEKIRGGGNLKVLVINGEDSTDEIRRRTYAFCLAHRVAEHDLKDLTIVGADDAWVQRISFLKTNEKGMSALNQDGLDALHLALDALHPDVIVLDPLVSFCAGGNMNDNAVMSSVMRKLKEIARNMNVRC
jgi:AAA domain